MTEVKPLCPVFGVCGGCSHQDVSYEDELRVKESGLRELFRSRLGVPENFFDPIVASPKPYGYRSRIDVGLLRMRSGKVVIGFAPDVVRRKIVPVESCAIAMGPLSDFMPRLKEEAVRKLKPRHRTASIVLKTGDDGRVLWGGIGRGSLRTKPEDYLWTDAAGPRIFYSLDTFFQANLSILSEAVRRVDALIDWKKTGVFIDLYAGVGLFGIALASKAARVVLVEDNPASVELARHNAAHHRLQNAEIVQARVEDVLPELLARQALGECVLFVDPPRGGLKPAAREALARAGAPALFYLSCHPESLVRDLESLAAGGWAVRKVVPFDFFPKTRHLETLVLLEKSV